MKPVVVKDDTCINFSKDGNDKDPKFKVGDHLRISNYKKKKIAEGCTPNWSEEVFVTAGIKNTMSAHVFRDFDGEEIIEIFYEKNLRKAK